MVNCSAEIPVGSMEHAFIFGSSLTTEEVHRAMPRSSSTCTRGPKDDRVSSWWLQDQRENGIGILQSRK